MNICKLPSIILFCGMNNIIYVMFIASKSLLHIILIDNIKGPAFDSVDMGLVLKMS